MAQEALGKHSFSRTGSVAHPRPSAASSHLVEFDRDIIIRVAVKYIDLSGLGRSYTRPERCAFRHIIVPADLPDGEHKDQAAVGKKCHCWLSCTTVLLNHLESASGSTGTVKTVGSGKIRPDQGRANAERNVPMGRPGKRHSCQPLRVHLCLGGVGSEGSGDGGIDRAEVDV